MKNATLAAACMLAGIVNIAQAVEIELPPETAAYRPSPLLGYQLVLANCVACHSAHYVQMQPPSSPRSYWDATVKKMKKPFGAPLAEQDIPLIVDYLAKTYGAEAAVAPGAPGKKGG